MQEEEKISNFQNKRATTLNVREENNDMKNYPLTMQNKPQFVKNLKKLFCFFVIQAQDTKKPIIIEDSGPKVRKTGRLKFFDEGKSYGFIVMDEDNSDIFVHLDDLSKAGVSKELLRSSKHGNVIRFSFLCMVYIGKYNKSKKAVELEII